MIGENRTSAFSFSAKGYPVVIQVSHSRTEILRPHFDEFQRPNWFFRDFWALRVSSNYDKKGAKEEARGYALFHGFTLRLSMRRTETAKGCPQTPGKSGNRTNGIQGPVADGLWGVVRPVIGNLRRKEKGPQGMRPQS